MREHKRRGFRVCAKTPIRLVFVAHAFRRALWNQADAHLKVGATRTRTEFPHKLFSPDIHGRLFMGFRVCVRTGIDASLILLEGGDAMGKFLDYNPDQAYLLPPSEIGRASCRERV